MFVHAIENQTHDCLQKKKIYWEKCAVSKNTNSSQICSVRTVKPEETKNVTKCLSNTIP